jgi:hypothetical protein
MNTADQTNQNLQAQKHRVSSNSEGLYYKVKRGKDNGVVLLPHIHEDGCYVVSPTRFKIDYIRVPRGEALSPWLKKGLKLRMSNPDQRTRAPSLIAPPSIEGLHR